MEDSCDSEQQGHISSEHCTGDVVRFFLHTAGSIPQYHLPTLVLDSSSQDLNKNCSPRIRKEVCRSADFESDGGRGCLALNMQLYATWVVACPVQVQ
jgi:hypothetical protein